MYAWLSRPQPQINTDKMMPTNNLHTSIRQKAVLDLYKSEECDWATENVVINYSIVFSGVYHKCVVFSLPSFHMAHFI